MPITDIEKVRFSSSYSTDKIVGVYSGSFDANTAPKLGSVVPYTTFSHGFSRPVFTKTMVSRDNVIWSDENSRNPYDSNSLCGISYSTSNNIYTLAQAGYTGTVYYRVVAFWIDDYDSTDPLVPETQGSPSDIFFDSRLNYQKIYSIGQLTNPAGTSMTHTVLHDLGYEPNVRIFCEMLPGQVWPGNSGGVKSAWLYDLDMVECEAGVYTDKVELITAASFASPSAKIWYVIYYDE